MELWQVFGGLLKQKGRNKKRVANRWQTNFYLY